MIFQKNPPKTFFFPHITSCHDVNDVAYDEWCVELWAPINLFKSKKLLYGHQPLFRFSSQRSFWTKHNPKNSKFVYKTFSTQEANQESLPNYNFYPIAGFWSVYIKMNLKTTNTLKQNETFTTFVIQNLMQNTQPKPKLILEQTKSSCSTT